MHLTFPQSEFGWQTSIGCTRLEKQERVQRDEAICRTFRIAGIEGQQE